MSLETNAKFRFKLDHVALTVADLKQAVAFYTEVLGAKLLYQMGPFDAQEIPLMDDGRDWTTAHINVEGARLNIAMMELTSQLKMELFQYDKPVDAGKQALRNCDVGSGHLCLEVENIETAVTYLADHGCRAMAGPIVMEEGPCPASKSWYVLDPFGHQLELVEYI